MPHITDPFTGTSGDTLNVYNANWVRHSSYVAATLIIDSTNARCRASNTTATRRLYYRAEDPDADAYEVTVDSVLVSDDGTAGGPAIRISTSADTLYFAWIGAPGGSQADFALYKRVAVAQTTLGTVTHTFAAGVTYRITVGVNGTNIYARVQRLSNNQWLTSGGTWQVSQVNCLSVTDTSISARGRMGLFVYGHVPGETTGPHFDNWEGGVDLALSPGAGSITSQGHDSIGYSFAGAIGGSGSGYTYEIYRVANATTAIGSGTLVGTSLTGTDTGLTVDTFYFYKCKVTDSLSATATTADADVTARAVTRAVALVTPNFYALGDSTTIGGEWLLTMADTLEPLLDIATITNAVSAAGGSAASGWDNTAEGNAAIAAASSAGATDLYARFGINDTDSAAVHKAHVVNIIAQWRAGVATLERIWLAFAGFTSIGGGSGGNPAAHAKKRGYQTAYREIVDEDSGADGVTVRIGNPHVYDFMACHTELLNADGVHWLSGLNTYVGQMEADWWYTQVVGELGEETVGGLIGSGTLSGGLQ